MLDCGFSRSGTVSIMDFETYDGRQAGGVPIRARRGGRHASGVEEGHQRAAAGAPGLACHRSSIVVHAARRDAAQDTDRDPLPARALARIGTYDLRTRDYISHLAFSPDGRLIAAAEHRNSTSNVSLFEVETGRQARRLVVPDQPGLYVDRLVFSPDGTILAWWAFLNNHRRTVGPRRPIGCCIALNDTTRQHRRSRLRPDGRVIAVGYEDGIVRVRVWRCSRPRPTGRPAGRRACR